MEFCVIHYHISFVNPFNNDFLSNYNLADNSMSFFFVLSGFCSMYSNLHTDFKEMEVKMTFIKKRLWKMYPSFFIWYLLDLPGAIMSQNQEECLLFWLAIASQPFLLHPWLGRHHIGISNQVCWYLGTLFWLWFLFPFLNLKKFFASHVWLKIIGLYILSLITWLIFYKFHIHYLRGVPVLRLCEFLMGCGAAFTLNKPLNGWLVLLIAFTFPLYCAITLEMPLLWPNEERNNECVLWAIRPQQNVTPTIFLSKFALPFCLVIHYLATNELASYRPLAFFHWEFFKTLNSFSLHTYLSHYIVACMIKSISTIIGIFHWWSLDVMLMACYLIAYLASNAELYLKQHISLTFISYMPVSQENMEIQPVANLFFLENQSDNSSQKQEKCTQEDI
jgi:hypothetical protein